MNDSNDEYLHEFPKVYAEVNILCLQPIKFPLYERTQHIQAEAGGIYPINCYCYAQVDFYVEMCNTLKDYLTVSSIVFTNEEAKEDALDKGLSDEFVSTLVPEDDSRKEGV